MKLRVHVSLPMVGKTEDEIIDIRDNAVTKLENLGYEVLETLFSEEFYEDRQTSSKEVVQRTLCFLAKSLLNMSLCHVVYFCKGWEYAISCNKEHDIAFDYGLKIIYEEKI